MTLHCLCKDFMTLPTALARFAHLSFLQELSHASCRHGVVPYPGNSVNLFLFLFPWVFQGNNATLNKVASLSMPTAVYHLSSISTSLFQTFCFCSGLNLFKPRKNPATETQIVGDQRSGAPSGGEWSCGARRSGSLTWTSGAQTSGTQKPCAITRNSSEHWRTR